MTEETLEKLAQLLEQDQFELLIPENMPGGGREAS